MIRNRPGNTRILESFLETCASCSQRCAHFIDTQQSAFSCLQHINRYAHGIRIICICLLSIKIKMDPLDEWLNNSTPSLEFPISAQNWSNTSSTNLTVNTSMYFPMRKKLFLCSHNEEKCILFCILSFLVFYSNHFPLREYFYDSPKKMQNSKFYLAKYRVSCLSVTFL